MREGQEFTDLVDEIYDVGLAPHLWTNVLTSIRDFVGAQVCGLVSKDAASKLGSIQHQVGADPHYITAYAKTYSKLDYLDLMPSPGRIVSIPELVPYDEYRKGRFYQEYLRPQGWADAAMVTLEKSGSSCGVALVTIPRGVVDDSIRQRVALIAPHLGRALRISNAIEIKQSEATTFAKALNSLSASMLLVDGNGRIVHANAAGQDMLHEGDVLRSIGGRFATCDPRVDQILFKSFAAPADVGAKAIALPLMTQGGERYVVHVLPLTSGNRRAAGLTYTAVAAMFVCKVALESPADVMAQVYSLTPAEQRVLQAIVEVGGVPETARALGIAETTVKTHLYRLFDKTGVGRQADLVKLVASFSNPLVD